MKRICFLLPSAGSHPVGGFKIVYQYANGLARRGYRVSVVHTCFLSRTELPFVQRIRRSLLRYARQSITAEWRPDRWFSLDPAVRLRWIPILRPVFLPRADIYVASWWQTAERLAEWKTNARKLHLIQHFETWAGPKERVVESWKAPLEKIVIARWLGRIAAEFGQKAVYIPNGLDFEQFGVDVPIEARDPQRIAMLYHDLEWKGSSDGLKALELLRGRYPGLRAELFGIPQQTPLPDWITYHRDPPQAKLREIYNRASIFLAPSWTEGWPLPPAEAMMSGAAVVATDIEGHREYCDDGRTALLAPPRDPRHLADAASTLIAQGPLRYRIARAGSENIRQFTWTRALSSFERALWQSPDEKVDRTEERLSTPLPIVPNHVAERAIHAPARLGSSGQNGLSQGVPETR